MSKVRQITARVLNVLVWTALVAVIAVIVVPRLLGWQVETVMSGSMEPALGVGSIIAVQPMDSAELAPGDVVTYLSNGTPPLTTHRIVEVLPDGSFVTKGDANEDRDITPVDDGAVVGRVAFSVPFLGYVAVAVKQPQGWALVAAGALFLWSVSELLKDRRKTAPATDTEGVQLAEQVAS